MHPVRCQQDDDDENDDEDDDDDDDGDDGDDYFKHTLAYIVHIWCIGHIFVTLPAISITFVAL